MAFRFIKNKHNRFYGMGRPLASGRWPWAKQFIIYSGIDAWWYGLEFNKRKRYSQENTRRAKEYTEKEKLVPKKYEWDDTYTACTNWYELHMGKSATHHCPECQKSQ